MSPLTRRILTLVVINFGLVMFGTLSYVILEEWTFVEGLYMTVITMGSVGYGEVKPLSEAGRLFTIGFILLGVGTLAYTFTVLVDSLVSAELRGEIRRRQMQRTIDRMKNHIIVCGYGRVGQNAVAALAREDHAEIVVLEYEEAQQHVIEEAGAVALIGDATQDETLCQAGIERAWGMLVCTGNDSINLFVVLSARTLNADLTIIARATDAVNESKMLRAGANRVISPYHIGGQRMAHSLMHPNLTEFLNSTMGSEKGIWLEDLLVQKGSTLDEQTLVDVDMRRRTGVTLLGIVRPNAEEVITPDATTRFQAGDELIVIGTREQLNALEKLMGL